jgi:hypothetical protein
MAAPSHTSTAQAIANNVLAPVAMLGNTLDVATGASSVRDVLTGQNPFDQFTSAWWKDAGNRASGRDVTTAMGLTKPNDPKKWEAGDFAGFGAEVLLDPATYLSGGASALAKGPGSTARAVGLTNRLTRTQRMSETPASLLMGFAKKHGPELAQVKTEAWKKAAIKQGFNPDEILNKPVGSWLKAHGPFGMGEIGGINNKFLAGTLDKLQKKMGESKVGQAVSALFEPAVKGRMGVTKQSMQRGWQDWTDEVQGDNHIRGVELGQKLVGLGDVFKKENPTLKDADSVYDTVIRNAFEKHGDSYDYKAALTKEFADQKLTPSPGLLSAAEQTMKDIRKDMDGVWDDLTDMGQKGHVKKPTKFHSYFPRRTSKEYLEATKQQRVDNAFGQASSTRKRDEWLQGLSTQTINAIRAGKGKNKNYYFGKHGATRIEKDFGNELGYSFMERGPRDPANPRKRGDNIQVDITPTEHALQLKKKLRIAQDVPMFEGRSVDDIFNHTKQMGRVADTSRFLHHQVGENFKEVTPETKDWITVSKLYDKLGMNRIQAVDYLARDLAKKGKTYDPKWLGKQKVSPEFAEAILDLAERSGKKTSQEGTNALSKFWDQATGAYKSNWTLPWVPFHLRNRSGGVLNNLMSGPFQNPLEAGAYLWREGQESVSQGRYAPEHEGAMLQMHAQGMFGTPDNPLATQDVALPTMDSMKGDPWNVRAAYAAGKQKATENQWYGQDTPYVGPVVGAVNTAHKTWMDMGEKAAGMTEYHNRAPLFKYLTESQ